MSNQKQEPRERPMIFQAESVRAILEGRKTMTRRVVKGLPSTIKCASLIPESGYQWRFTDFSDTAIDLRCPYGRSALPLEPGERLWVREKLIPKEESAANGSPRGVWAYYAADNTPVEGNHIITKVVSPIRMPRWASRITLEITDVRVERLQDISYEDAAAEGVESWPGDCPGCIKDWGCSQPKLKPEPHCDVFMLGYKESFRKGWDILNAKRGFSWDSNPFVWAITFRKL